MDELAKMMRAKEYLDKLANGIDPISDAEVPQDTVLNQVRLSRCFFYVSDVLRQVIEQGGVVGKSAAKTAKVPFHITEDELARIEVSAQPLLITKFCEHIHSAIGDENRPKLSYRPLTDWLLAQGYLREEIVGNARRRRVGERGTEIGMHEEKRIGSDKEYYAILYSPAAQQFLLNNLMLILGS